MLNICWIALLIIGFVTSVFTGKIEATVNAAFDACTAAVELCIGILGVMCLWCGLVKITEKSGLAKFIGRISRPFVRFLFPKTAHDEKAISAIMMNITANFLGIGNAATPLGIKACKEIKRVQLNDEGRINQEIASDDMCMFIIINTASIQLIPSTIMALAQASGSNNPSNIIVPIWITSGLTFLISVIMVKVSARLRFKFGASEVRVCKSLH